MNEGCTTATLDTASGTLHPSAIRFTCPPWCIIGREEHLEELGNNLGAAHHVSAYREGPGWSVSLESFTYPDGTPCVGLEETLISVDVDPWQPMAQIPASELRDALTAAGTEALR